ncbi:hypothetical protein [Nonomuraea pusilla]|uniref:Uncharacterized protein n=1 Tax=Nonomuraea pusilla TaxID=46177 RepID=A0A1H7I7C1_9ACTN|nr:hypothetical protein [Nonomuraea pusilla]SEK57380.1 hypothetical protein SAMN05660976_00687 [Nonomuraea pusilla]
MRRIIRLFATSAVVTAGTIAATAAAASADIGVGAGATVQWVPLGSLLFSDRNIKRDVVAVQWDR